MVVVELDGGGICGSRELVVVVGLNDNSRW